MATSVPPAPESLLHRARAALFPGPWSGAMTVAVGLGLAWLLWRALDWALVGAVFEPDYAACRALDYRHACWGFVAEKHRLILFGRYPYAEQWRPLVALLAIAAALVVTAVPRFWTRRLWAIWAVALGTFFVLMRGGIAGLAPVETSQWGGLPLTVLLTLVAMVASVPVGVLLALGRRSTLPLVRTASTAYIELVRGLPLITVLFVASFVFPLFMPPSLRTDPLTRILVGLTLFQAAYFAETLRGGLQAIPQGQYLAARALGLGYWAMHASVILPQAFVHVIPAFVNSLLSTFMDTSLVTVVSMYDLTGSLRLALGDPQWRAFFIEGYAFVAAIYFAGCLAMSRYSRWLERRLGRGRHLRQVPT
jgi:general L-amino acid transport system permease protein